MKCIVIGLFELKILNCGTNPIFDDQQSLLVYLVTIALLFWPTHGHIFAVTLYLL